MKTLLFALLLTIFSPMLVQNANLSEAVDFEQLQEHINLKHYLDFKEKLALLESSARYRITSPSGSYLGKYQFGRQALSDIAFDYSADEFLDSKLLQEQALYRYLQKNRLYLAQELETFVGDTVGGVHITEAGLLAAAHLAGAGNVKRFLYSSGSVVFRDGNNTPITKYLREFAQYRFKLNQIVYRYIAFQYA